MNPKKKTPRKAPSVSFTLRLTGELAGALDKLARQNNITRSAVIQIAVSRIVQSGI